MALNHKLPDLRAKFLDLPILLGRVRFGLARGYPGHDLERLALPSISYRLMHAVL